MISEIVFEPCLKILYSIQKIFNIIPSSLKTQISKEEQSHYVKLGHTMNEKKYDD